MTELDPIRVKSETEKRAGERWPSRKTSTPGRVAAAEAPRWSVAWPVTCSTPARTAVQGVADTAAVADDESCGSILDAARLAETFAEERGRVARDANEGGNVGSGRFDSFDAVA